MIYDVIIIGAGPAGLTASIYTSRYKLSNIVIGKKLGGELSLAHDVCNFPGFKSITGLELSQKMREQVEDLGVEVLLKEVGKIEKVDGKKFNFKVYINKEKFFKTRSLIIATGSERRRLNIPGEEKYLGKGVSYCTACDAGLYKDKTVAMIGGSDSAVSGAIHVAEYAEKVYIIYRRDKLRAEPIWVKEWKKIGNTDQGETIYNTNVVEFLGDGNKITAVKLDNPYKNKKELNLDGVFVEIGGVPGTSLIQPLGIEMDKTGHIQVNTKMETNVEGLFCAGDLTCFSADFKQAVTAAGQGARAAGSAYKFIKKENAPIISH